MTAPSTRPTNQDRIRAALWFAERGFGIFPVWSTRDGGTCRCPAERDCSSPGKHPLTNDGFKSATMDAARITTFLSAASEPNYGMTCPDGVFALDVDGDGIEQLADLEARYGPLPVTLRTQTANGQHIFLRWPDEHPRPLKQLFGFVTRWGTGSHAGYVIGPRSVHPSGVEYAPVEDSFDIATLPDAWAVAGVTAGPSTVTVSTGPRLETVGAGGRHDFLRDRARTLRGGGLSGEALFEAVMQVNADYCVPPKSADEVRRAIGDVEHKYEPDPLPGTVEHEERVTSGEPPMMSPTDDDTLFPADLSAVAFGGVLGECTEFLLDGTDSSPVAVLASLVAFCGALMPARGYWHGQHTSSPFLALVGKSGIGRKGTAMYRVRDALGNTLGMDAVNRVRFDGIASGEALVRALLDRSQVTFGVPTGVLFEEEYATFLAASGREGSNLDSRMRSAFDGKQLAHRKVAETISVPEPYYLSGLVAITPEELQGRVSKSSFKNGSGNRWLWLPVVRRDVRVASSEPIFPVEMSEALIEAHRVSLRAPARIDPGTGVDDLLSQYDDYLRAESVGLAADMTRRFGVIAFRIGLVHAAVERAPFVTVEHILRAIALTEYARAGLPFCFGDALGDESATYLLRLLIDSDEWQLPQWTISKYFIRDPIKRQAAIDDLCRLGVAEVVRVSTRGRKGSVLRLLPLNRDFRDFCALIGVPQIPEITRTSVAERGIRGAEGAQKCAEERDADAQKVRRSAQKSRPEPVVDHSTGEVETAEEATWAKHCADYRAHQDDLRNTLDGWICVTCHPPAVEEASS